MIPAALRTRMAAVVAGGFMAVTGVFVAFWEGTENEAYIDPVGIWTACTGHTGNVVPGRVYTDAECESFLRTDLAVAFEAVKRHLRVPVADETMLALVSFTFNVGEGQLSRSTLLRRLNAGEGYRACAELDRWVCGTVKPGYGDTGGPCRSSRNNKRALPGLVKRRKAEREMCEMGFLASPPPVARNDNVPVPLARPERRAG